MVKFGIILGLIAILAVGGLFLWSKIASAEIGNINIYTGSASVLRRGTPELARTGHPVKRGDVITVGPDSRVSIVLKDGSVIRFEANSEIKINELRYEGGEVVDASFSLLYGKMWSKVEPLESGSNWRVETPTVVASVRGTAFNTRYTDETSGVSVYEGVVGVGLISLPQNEKNLQVPNQFIISDLNSAEDFAKDPIVMDPKNYDDWIIFNLKEDAKLKGTVYESEIENKLESTTTEPTSPITPATIPASLKLSEKKLLAVSVLGYKSIILVNEETKVKASAKYSDNSDYEIPFEKINWIQNPRGGSLTAPGYFSSSKPGTFVFQAEFNGVKSGPVTITVKESLKVLKRIELSYTKNQSESYSNYRYPTVQFNALARFDDNTTKDITTNVDWSLESGSAGGAIQQDGLYTPETNGEATISAEYEGETDSLTVLIP